MYSIKVTITFMTLACVTFAATNHVAPRATLSNEYGAEFIGSAGYYDPINSLTPPIHIDIPPKYSDDLIRSYIPPKYPNEPKTPKPIDIPPRYTADPIRSYIPPKYIKDPIRSYIPPEEKFSKIIENNELAMNYNFEYNVEDYQSGNNFGHMESRDGDRTTGRFHVFLPDGRTQIVTYVADENGYQPIVTYV